VNKKTQSWQQSGMKCQVYAYAAVAWLADVQWTIARGAGPVGILAAQCCFARGAQRVILIDNQEYRLKRAKEAMPQLETINFSKKPTLEQLKELVPHGAHNGSPCTAGPSPHANVVVSLCPAVVTAALHTYCAAAQLPCNP